MIRLGRYQRLRSFIMQTMKGQVLSPSTQSRIGPFKETEETVSLFEQQLRS